MQEFRPKQRITRKIWEFKNTYFLLFLRVSVWFATERVFIVEMKRKPCNLLRTISKILHAG